MKRDYRLCIPAIENISRFTQIDHIDPVIEQIHFRHLRGIYGDHIHRLLFYKEHEMFRETLQIRLSSSLIDIRESVGQRFRCLFCINQT